MSKKRNKQSLISKQKVLEAQHRNDYFRRLGTFLMAVTGENVLALLPQSQLNILYTTRSYQVGVEAETGHDVPVNLTEGIKKVVNNWLKTREKPIAKTGKQVNLADYFFFGYGLNICFKNAINYKNSERIRELLSPEFEDLGKVFDCFYDEVTDYVFLYLIMQLNNFTGTYYSFKLELIPLESFRMKYVIKIKTYPVEKAYLNLNGIHRLVYRIGWTFQENSFEWLKVTPAQLGINSAFGNLPIPVYIQSHALYRLIQRAGCIRSMYLKYSMWVSLNKFEFIRDGDKYLISFYVGVKIGYFVAIFSGGSLVIRTFLFLTCKGAPEGKRLEKNVGLQMLDTKYLQMDKLSSFMSPGLKNNPELCSIFEKADCMHLLQLSEKLAVFIEKSRENSPLELITEYLKTEEDTKEWLEEAEV